MKSIHTLIRDIYETVQTDGWFNDDLSKDFVGELGSKLVKRSGPREQVPRLRLSQMGPVCEKQLWHSIHTPSLQESLPAYTRIKFTYGDILESLVISMAKSAGHEVTGEQDEITVDGVSGHRDCVIDGCVVDVKSAASRPFQVIKAGIGLADDPFLCAYLDQLDGYLVGSAEDDLVRVKDKAYILAIDKTLGHLCTYEHTIRQHHIRSRIENYKRIVGLSSPPRCTCGTVPDGVSGNIKLDTKASYSSYKHVCFPNLRTFLYSGKVVHLVKVIREPKVPELYNGRTLVEGEVGTMEPAGDT